MTHLTTEEMKNLLSQSRKYRGDGICMVSGCPNTTLVYASQLQKYRVWLCRDHIGELWVFLDSNMPHFDRFMEEYDKEFQKELDSIRSYNEEKIP